MAIVKPFKGVRPPQDLVEQVASRPYDVLNSAEAREEAKGNEKSLYHIIKPEIDFPEGTDEHDPRVYSPHESACLPAHHRGYNRSNRSLLQQA